MRKKDTVSKDTVSFFVAGQKNLSGMEQFAHVSV